MDRAFSSTVEEKGWLIDPKYKFGYLCSLQRYQAEVFTGYRYQSYLLVDMEF